MRRMPLAGGHHGRDLETGTFEGCEHIVKAPCAQMQMQFLRRPRDSAERSQITALVRDDFAKLLLGKLAPIRGDHDPIHRPGAAWAIGMFLGLRCFVHAANIPRSAEGSMTRRRSFDDGRQPARFIRWPENSSSVSSCWGFRGFPSSHSEPSRHISGNTLAAAL